jgi:hypothetical protein
MTDETSVKRRRGAQRGNQNAKGNRGNSHPRRNYGNRGGAGAPERNQFARRRPLTLGAALLSEYAHDVQARAWIEEHFELLKSVPDESTQRANPIDIAQAIGLTPEAIVEKGREYALGLYACPEPQVEVCPAVYAGRKRAA